MSNPDDVLAQIQSDLECADYDEATTGLDRRQFVFFSLAAAAATTLGVEPALAQPTRVVGSPRQEREPPFALGNGEAPAVQFQPYPGGTGAL